MTAGQDPLGQIRPLAQVPPDQPDSKTAAETQEFKRKALTPTEREAESRRAHLETLNGQIVNLNGEKDGLRRQIETLHRDLAAERQRFANLSVRHARLEEATRATGRMMRLGNIMVVVGATFLGIGGCYPSLTDTLKSGMAWAGGALAFFGLIMTIFPGNSTQQPETAAGERRHDASAGSQ